MAAPELFTALLALIGYVAATWLGVRTLRSHARGLAARLLGALAIAAHAGLLVQLLLTPDGIDLSLFRALSLFTLVVVAALEVTRIDASIDKLFLLAYPLAALSLPVALLLDVDHHAMTHVDGTLALHVVLSLVAYALVTLACAQAALLMVQEHWLRSPDSFSRLGMLMPQQLMERALFRLLGLGLAVMTGALLSGVLTLQDIFGQRVVHHTVLSIAAWLIFAVLLAGRWLWGWRGVIASRWLFAGFLVLGLAYFGSKTMIEIILPPR